MKFMIRATDYGYVEIICYDETKLDDNAKYKKGSKPIEYHKSYESIADIEATLKELRVVARKEIEILRKKDKR